MDSMMSSPGHYTAEHSRSAHGQRRHDDSDSDVSSVMDDDSLLEALDLSTTTGVAPLQSTPKAKKRWHDDSNDDSAFEALGRELTMKYPSPPRAAVPTTPRQRRPRALSSPASSPFRAPPPARTPGVATDHIMHRVLDQTWRLQATPIAKQTPSRYLRATTPRQPPLFSHSRAAGSDGDSSPICEPQLQTQIFTPGVLRTPGANRFAAAAAAAVAASGAPTGPRYNVNMYDDDSDDEILGWSPPKTMQFALPPSKLMATPAREASRRIVRDILNTAGASFDGTMTTQDSSPTRETGADGDDDLFKI